MAEPKDRVSLSEIQDNLIGWRFGSNYVIDWICKVHHPLLPQPLQTHVGFTILLHHFTDRHFEVLLSHVHSPLSQCEHTGLSAHSFCLGSWSTCHLLSNFCQIYSSHKIHFSWVNFKNLYSWLYFWVWKLNFSINTSRSQESRVEYINSICRHNNLNCLSCLKTI